MDKNIKHSIVLTIHNKGWLLERVFDGIVKNTKGEYELIIVLDGCSDNSSEVIEKYFEDSSNPPIVCRCLRSILTFEFGKVLPL